jgi:osmotically inducible protein OsmC
VNRQSQIANLQSTKEHEMKRHASAVWHGNLKDGKGALTTESGVLRDTPYSFAKRFESEAGTNPEELLAAAHAGCFTMALAAKLSREGITPERLSTRANLTLEQVQGNWTVTTVHLELHANVPGFDHAKFEEMAADAKTSCIVSRALNANITLEMKLEW